MCVPVAVPHTLRHSPYRVQLRDRPCGVDGSASLFIPFFCAILPPSPAMGVRRSGRGVAASRPAFVPYPLAATTRGWSAALGDGLPCRSRGRPFLAPPAVGPRPWLTPRARPPPLAMAAPGAPGAADDGASPSWSVPPGPSAAGATSGDGVSGGGPSSSTTAAAATGNDVGGSAVVGASAAVAAAAATAAASGEPATTSLRSRLIYLARALRVAVDSEQYGTAAAVAAEVARIRRADPSLSAMDDLAVAVAGEDFGAAAAAATRLRRAVTVAPASVTTPPGVVVVDGGGPGDGVVSAAADATATPAADSWGGGHLTNRLLTLSPADSDGRMCLATVAPDGSNGLSLELESGGGLLLQPTWSPDGMYVAVADVRLPLSGTRREGGGALASAAAYVVILSALDGTEVRRVRVSPPPFYFQWSADGSLLTFLHNEPVLPSSAEPGGGGGLPSSPPRRSRRVRASVVSTAPGADTDAVPFAGGHPLYYAMSPEGGKALVYAGDDRKVAVYDLAEGPGGGAGVGGVPPPRVLSTSSGALATPQWLPRPHRQAAAVGYAAEAASTVPSAEDDEPLVLLLEDERPADAGAGGGVASDTFSAGSPPQALVLMSATDPSRRRVLGRFWGHVRYTVAPGGGRLAVLVTNPLSGREELSVIEGPFTLDPPGAAGGGVDAHGGARGGAAIPADAILSNPANRAVAFFWSPDGRRLLFLTTPRNGGGGGGGMGGAPRSALYAWAVFDAVTGRVARFVRHRLPTVGPLLLSFFDQHARSTTFWAPDSASFVYAAIPVQEGEEAAVGEAADAAGAAAAPPADAVSDSEARWLRGSGGSGGAASVGGSSSPLPPMRSAAAPAAFVQTLPAALMDATLPRADLIDTVEPPRRVADGVQYTSWSPC